MNTTEIKIIGVGTAGSQVLEKIPFLTNKNADCIVCDIDAKDLAKSSIQNKMLFGSGIVKHLSIQSQVEIGMYSVLNSELDLAINSAIDSSDQLDSLFGEDSKTVILIADLGNTTGAGATPVIAQIAKKRGLYVAAVVYTPFDFIGDERKKISNNSLKNLREDCDFVFVIDNNKIQKFYGNLSFKASFGKAVEAIKQLMKLLLPTGSSDIDKILAKKIKQVQSVFFGFGEAQGEFRERKAIEEALKNALYDREDIYGVTNVFLQICFGNREITIDEMNKIKEAVLQNSGNDANITISVEEDAALEDSLSVVVIAM